MYCKMDEVRLTGTRLKVGHYWCERHLGCCNNVGFEMICIYDYDREKGYTVQSDISQ